MIDMTRVQVLDQGYVELVDSWGSDEAIIEAARMSTAKGFLGWGPQHVPPCRGGEEIETFPVTIRPCTCTPKPGDEKLLKYLWDHQHSTPFEMAGITIEVKAPIMVFREWMRHRTQSFSERSARYTPLPDENYMPDIGRIMSANGGTQNRQAQGKKDISALAAAAWLGRLEAAYGLCQEVYAEGIELGVPKELARLCVPVGRYSVMRATANLRNWLGFLKLRCDPNAQWEIRQYANALAEMVREKFPRTYEVSKGSFLPGELT